MNAGSRLLTAQAAARYLGVPYTSLRDLGLRGVIPVVKIPGVRRLYFDVHELDAAVVRWKNARHEPGTYVRKAKTEGTSGSIGRRAHRDSAGTVTAGPHGISK